MPIDIHASDNYNAIFNRWTSPFILAVNVAAAAAVIEQWNEREKKIA